MRLQHVIGHALGGPLHLFCPSFPHLSHHIILNLTLLLPKMLPPFPSSEISPEASRKTDALSIHSVITFHCQVLQADYLAVCLIYCQATSPM